MRRIQHGNQQSTDPPHRRFPGGAGTAHGGDEAGPKIFATYTQEQVDHIFRAVALAINKQRIPLAKLAVEETGMGVLEDKVIKNHFATEYIYNYYKDTKTCGVIEEDKVYGVKKIAEPIGLIAAVIPTTNPTSTAIFKTLLALKTRNAIIISPHPGPGSAPLPPPGWCWRPPWRRAPLTASSAGSMSPAWSSPTW